MRETETYVKVHDFLIDQLKLPDIPKIVFAVIFTATSSDADKALYGCSFIAKRAHICIRSVKQGLRCLLGIGIIKKIGVTQGGANKYVSIAEDCETTTEAKEKLVNAIHQCTLFTGARDAPERCIRCTYGGAYRARQIIQEDNKIKTTNYATRNFRQNNREPAQEFEGSDTL